MVAGTKDGVGWAAGLIENTQTRPFLHRISSVQGYHRWIGRARDPNKTVLALNDESNMIHIAQRLHIVSLSESSCDSDQCSAQEGRNFFGIRCYCHAVR